MRQHKNRVLQSINQPGEQMCVDIFERPDGTFGFEEFRRDPEDGSGWFAVGRFAVLTFDNPDDARVEAIRRVAWLAAVLS